MLRERLLQSLDAHFGADAKRIAHAREVLRVAEELLRVVPADPRIVIPAAILHDVGIKPAEEKYGSAAGPLQEKEGPPVARAILRELGVPHAEAEEICAIVGRHHSPGPIETLNFGVLFDADCVVNFADAAARTTPEELGRAIEATVLTDAGRRLARQACAR
jgi:hypothetical protein